MKLEINPHDIPIGDVVYFILPTNRGVPLIHFGIVESHYTHEICIKRIERRDNRIINGIPIAKLQTPTRWKKLPRGWHYDTKLFSEEWDDSLREQLKNIHIDNPEELKKAYNDGILVDMCDENHVKIESEIDNSKGYRLVRKYGKYYQTIISLNYHKVYTTYKQAKDVVDAWNNEAKRISELSDYEWSVELIDDVLDRWAYIYHVPDDTKQKYREWILSRDNVEEIEVRMFGGAIQWKYWKNKRWMAIIVD